MAKDKNRGCVSIKGETHCKLKAKAISDGVSMSAAVEGEIVEFLNKAEPRKPLVRSDLKVNKVVRR